MNLRKVIRARVLVLVRTGLGVVGDVNVLVQVQVRDHGPQKLVVILQLKVLIPRRVIQAAKQTIAKHRQRFVVV